MQACLIPLLQEDPGVHGEQGEHALELQPSVYVVPSQRLALPFSQICQKMQVFKN